MPRHEVIPLTKRIKDGRIFQVSRRSDRGIVYLKCRTQFCFGTAKLMPDGQVNNLRQHSLICFADKNLIRANSENDDLIVLPHNSENTNLENDDLIQLPHNGENTNLDMIELPNNGANTNSENDDVIQFPNSGENTNSENDDVIQLPNNEPPPAAEQASHGRVSASRKKNQRKKRRRQMKKQNLGHVKPYGHKRRKPKAAKCVVCLTQLISHAFIPCGHNCCCENCGTEIASRVPKTCPKCQAPFTQLIRIFNET